MQFRIVLSSVTNSCSKKIGIVLVLNDTDIDNRQTTAVLAVYYESICNRRNGN